VYSRFSTVLLNASTRSAELVPSNVLRQLFYRLSTPYFRVCCLAQTVTNTTCSTASAHETKKTGTVCNFILKRFRATTVAVENQ
jgi:hypothetical protein